MVTSSGGTVTLRIPASSAYLSLARAATASVCARADFPLDRLEDAGLAVDEALSLLLLDAVPGTELVCRWTARSTDVQIEVSSTSTSGRTPRSTSFSWMVLSALVARATAAISGGIVTISLTAARAEAVVS